MLLPQSARFLLLSTAIRWTKGESNKGVFIPGVEEDGFIWGGTRKKIADRPRGHGKGEGTGVGCAPSRMKRGSLFQTLIKCV